ncbi:hypothetical protein [Sphingobium yanoikuyae]|jgi:hypothetical protein|uniref:Uncharacterized protein n=1 Tax=Sphingobium yanoikuyae TaxID=13690 RepID=A0A085K3R2_SPHYA|nr:hypothetical protein [Sphingobium yanoikuyae]AYO80320.1 hypothetical protein EBF16_27725 [Sphingobium yanoikuyae]KFD27358.1 hypothetical protein IH86_15300 [Sphingobium yanoikuyae]KZC80619.1 hypothetical protein AYR46_10365 [Sphingobium yanoikuyae]MDV3480134.1 hypothetical protein [Sphingobium yanoikuyae]
MLSIVLALGAADPGLPHSWAEFGRAAALSHVEEKVEIATDPDRRSSEFPYRLRYSRTDGDGQVMVRWADSRDCPTVTAVIHGMRDMKPPAIQPYGIPGESLSIVMDGTGYFLSAPSADLQGRIRISSNVKTPLARWVDNAFTRLAPCWRDKPGA